MSLTQKDFRPNTKLFRSARLPQAPPPFLSILAALFVPLLGDETTKFTWCGDGEGGRKWMSLLESPFRQIKVSKRRRRAEKELARGSDLQEHLCLPQPSIHNCLWGWKGGGGGGEGLRGRSIAAERAEGEGRGGLRSRRGGSADARAHPWRRPRE